MPKLKITNAERLWSKVEKSGECWTWIGAVDENGYGYLSIKDRHVRTHRLSWAIAHGEIPPGLYVCHHCDNPPCVRPSHLFLGTNSDNQKDAIEKGRRPGMWPSCKYGHALTNDNVSVYREPSGKLRRRCLICKQRRYEDCIARKTA